MIRWFGSITGIIGALMLALNNEYSMYGYIFFILSSLSLTFIFCLEHSRLIFFLHGRISMANLTTLKGWLTPANSRKNLATRQNLMAWFIQDVHACRMPNRKLYQWKAVSTLPTMRLMRFHWQLCAGTVTAPTAALWSFSASPTLSE